MSLGDALLTFVSVFVAALFAFYLDGLRERRATRGWTREYLGFWRSVLELSQGDRAANEESLARVQAALDTWLGGHGTAPDWTDVDSINVNTAVSFTPLLLSTGASSVPKALLGQMFTADATAPALLRRSESVARLYDAHVLPLVLGEVVDLSPEQRRAVERYRTEFRGLRDHMSGYLDLLDAVRVELVRLGV
jgi:hypothetical protein